MTCGFGMATPLHRSEWIKWHKLTKCLTTAKQSANTWAKMHGNLSAAVSISTYEWISCSAYASFGTVWQNELAKARRGFSQTAHIMGNFLFWIKSTFLISRHNFIGNKFLFVDSKDLSDFRLLINANIRLNQCKKSTSIKVTFIHLHFRKHNGMRSTNTLRSCDRAS
jgi:hypothetical protein